MLKLGFASTLLLLLLATLSGVAFASPIEPHDIKSFEQCLRGLTKDASKLASEVNAIGNNLSYGQALAINDQTNVVKGDLNHCYNDVKDVTTIPPNNDVKIVLGLFENLAPIIMSTLNTIVSKKSAFEKLPFAVQLLLPQLKALYGDSRTLESALNRLTPSNYKAEAMKIENAINAAFEKAIRAYS